jgi:hypothetical protein
MQQARDDLAKAQAQLQAKLDAETQALQAEVKVKTETMAQRDALTKEKAELQSQLQAETQGRQAEAAAKAAMQQARDDLAKAQAQLQAKLDAETQALQAEVKAKTETMAQRDALTKEKAELQSKLQAETQARQAEAAAKAAMQQELDRLAKAQTEIGFTLEAAVQAKQSALALVEVLQAQKTEAIAQNTKLTKEHQQLKDELKTSQTELDQLMSQVKKEAQEQAQKIKLAESLQLRPVSKSNTFYLNLPEQKFNSSAPFLLIESKSLPRSGLHYLKNTLSKIFGEHFSFCEWYQEPGCCKQSPCSYTGFASHAKENSSLRIRLIKSHDFDLKDPIYPTSPHVRRLVLVRDPLYILTSWFALDQLNEHKKLLADNGIIVNKIWLSHEKEVITPAYQLLDEHFIEPTLEKLTAWLEAKSQYISGFMKKWVTPVDPMPNNNNKLVVRYEDINQYVAKLANEFKPYLTQDVLPSLDQGLEHLNRQFSKREEPFKAPASSIAFYIESHAELFKSAAKKACE